MSHKPQGLGTEGVLQEENPPRCSKDPYMGARAGLPIDFFQRECVLTVAFIILGPLNLPRERLGGSLHSGLILGVAFEVSALAERASAGGFMFVCLFRALLSLPKLTSLIFYKYSVLKQMTNFRYT